MSELDSLLKRIQAKYNVGSFPLQIGNKTLKILQMKDFEDYILNIANSESPYIRDIPFWAKVWDSSLLLAYYLGKRPVVLGERMLEIGAGVGHVGIYASLCGHRVTISDINEDSLMFARANALLNDVSHVEVKKIDWYNTEAIGPYDVIFGSEVVYERHSYPQFVDFLYNAISPNGMIFLAKDATLHAPQFFIELTKYFEFKQTTQTVKCGGENQQVCLYAIRLKKDAKNKRR